MASSSSPSRRPDRARTVIRIVVITAVLALALWYMLRGIDWDKLWQAVLSAGFGWILLMITASISGHVTRALRWRLLIPDGAKIPLIDLFSATIIGFMLNNLIPRSGELGRPYVLARRHGRSTSSMVATIVVERILDGLSLALIFVALVVIASDKIDRLLPGYSAGGVLAAIVLPVLALIGIVVLVLKTSYGDRLLAWIAAKLPARIGTRVASLLQEFRAGVVSVTPGAKLGIAIWTIAIWAGYGLSFYFGFLAFGFDSEYGLGAGASVMILGVTTIGYAVAPTPGAFGVYHLFCTAALTGLYAVPSERALAFALVTHGAPYLAVTVLGALFSLRENISLGSAVKGGSPDGPDVSGSSIRAGEVSTTTPSSAEQSNVPHG